MENRRAFIILFVLIGGFIALGTLGYHWIMGWTLVDSLYMMIITVTTIGYGTPGKLDASGELYTIALAFVSYIIFTSLVGLVTYSLVGIRFDAVLRRRRMEKKIAQMRDHYILCGAGRVGRQIMTEFLKTHQEFVVIEQKRDRIEHLMEQHPTLHILEGDASDNEVLEKAGIQRARGLLAVLDSDSGNLFLCLTARDLNPKLRIVSRASQPESMHKLEKAGADHVVLPAEIGALRMASVMIRPTVVNFLDIMIRKEDLTLRMEQVDIPHGSRLAGKRLADAEIPKHTDLMVIAAHQESTGKYLFNPKGDFVITAGDSLIILGTPEQRKRLESLARA